MQSARLSIRAATFALLAPGLARSEESIVVAPAPGQALLALGAVLVLILAGAWLLRRVQPARANGNRTLRLVDRLNVGHRERVVVIEAGDRWLVLGITAHSINRLHSLPRPVTGASPTKPADSPGTRSFAHWLGEARRQIGAAGE